MNVSLICVVALSLTLVPFIDSHSCHGKYMCKRESRWSARRTCIDKAALCDNNANCPLNDDEEDCSAPATTCSLLPRPENGNVYIYGLQTGDTAEYSCNAGYFLIGPSPNQTCINAIWRGNVPICDVRM